MFRVLGNYKAESKTFLVIHFFCSHVTCFVAFVGLFLVSALEGIWKTPARF